MSKPDNNTILIDRKIAGVVRDTLLDIRKSESHYCRKHRGFGVDPRTLDEAEAKGAVNVQITITDTGKVYRCSVIELRQYAIPDNLGAGLQLFMPVSYFKWCAAQKSKLHKNEPVPLQFALFDGQKGGL